MPEHSNQRRDFVKKAAYIAPAILTLAATPAYAKAGSQKITSNRRDDPVHPGHPDHPERP
jgi:hypothetical protein